MTNRDQVVQSGGVSAATGRWVLTAAIIASSMAFIDSTALNVALPALQRELGATGADLLWIVNGYTMLLAGLLLVGGALGDRWGRKRVLMLGVVLFAVASLACGLAPTTPVLIGARIVQGIGGALMVPGSLALISASFNATQRGRAIGTWSAVSTITTILGPALGGVLANAGLWRLVFLINLPFAAAALVVLQRYVPESRDESAPPRLDYPGALLATTGLIALTYGCLEAPGRGWLDVRVLVALLVGAATLIAFPIVESRTAHPMVPLSLFRSRTFSGTNLLTLFLYAALYGTSFFVPLNLIQVQGYSEAAAGLASVPSTILLALLSRWTGGFADRYGPRLPLTLGPALAGLGFLLYALPGVTRGPADYWTTFFPAVIVVGLGLGITVAPLTAAVMGAVSSQHAGVASGINNAVARSAGVLAIAVLGALALVTFRGALETQTQPLNLSLESRARLNEQAANLAGAQPPPALDSQAQSAVRAAINSAFVDTFRRIVIISAILAWLSALLAALTVPPRAMSPVSELSGHNEAKSGV